MAMLDASSCRKLRVPLVFVNLLCITVLVLGVAIPSILFQIKFVQTNTAEIIFQRHRAAAAKYVQFANSRVFLWADILEQKQRHFRLLLNASDGNVTAAHRKLFYFELSSLLETVGTLGCTTNGVYGTCFLSDGVHTQKGEITIHADNRSQCTLRVINETVYVNYSSPVFSVAENTIDALFNADTEVTAGEPVVLGTPTNAFTYFMVKKRWADPRGKIIFSVMAGIRNFSGLFIEHPVLTDPESPHITVTSPGGQVVDSNVAEVYTTAPNDKLKRRLGGVFDLSDMKTTDCLKEINYNSKMPDVETLCNPNDVPHTVLINSFLFGYRVIIVTPVVELLRNYMYHTEVFVLLICTGMCLATVAVSIWLTVPLIRVKRAVASVESQMNANVKTFVPISLRFEERKSFILEVDELWKTLHKCIDVTNTSFKAADDYFKGHRNFLANTSHEIRTPLNGIIGSASLLKNTELNVEQHQLTETIEMSSQHLLAVLNDILDSMKTEFNNLQLQFEPLSYIDEIFVCLELVRGMIQTKNEHLMSEKEETGIELVFRSAIKSAFTANGDALRVRQCVINLLQNAVKFTEQGIIECFISIVPGSELPQRITVEHFKMSKRTYHSETAELVESGVTLLQACSFTKFIQISISDSGEGVPKGLLTRCFEKFYQVNTNRNRSRGGTGLGLPLVRDLARMMGGGIYCYSGEEGSVFTLLFPVFDESPVQESIFPERFEAVISIKMSDTVTRSVIEMYCDYMGAHVEDSGSIVFIDADHLSLLKESERSVRYIYVGDTKPGIELPGFLIPLRSPFKPETFVQAVQGHVRLFVTAPVKICIECLGKLNVLVAEDNLINQRIFVQQLVKLGIAAGNIHVAVNGFEAVKKYKAAPISQPFDIVFMDIQMPECDGIEACSLIRAFEAQTGKRVCICAMTANSFAEDKEACLKVGMDGYITKPISLTQVENILVRVATPEDEIP